jgi:hypothetical protein
VHTLKELLAVAGYFDMHGTFVTFEFIYRQLATKKSSGYYMYRHV